MPRASRFRRRCRIAVVFLRFAVIASIAALPALCQDWSPQLAAKYLDARQQEWIAWPRAKAVGGVCVSCHTGLPYLLARPALRKALGEKEPTSYEIGLMDGLRARIGTNKSVLQGVDAIFAAMFVRSDPAFEQMWSMQASNGSLRWYSAGLDPWEMPESTFYGSALAATALGNRDKEHTAALMDYLQHEQAAQPLHNRLMLLLVKTYPESVRKQIAEEAFAKQQADGGWALGSLGPWHAHESAPANSGSNSYATAFTAFALGNIVPPSNAGLRRALDWLKAKQDRETGAWAADSMNKQYPADSMERKFMQDAATAFASLALLPADSR